MRTGQTGAPELRLETAGAQALPSLVPEAAGAVADAEEMSFTEVIKFVNDKCGTTGLSTSDQVLLGQVVVAVIEDPELRAISLQQDQDVLGGHQRPNLFQVAKPLDVESARGQWDPIWREPDGLDGPADSLARR